MHNDAETDDGVVFVGMGIAYGDVGMVQLWNPPDSGVYAYVDRVYSVVSVSGSLGVDIRKTSIPLSAEMMDAGGNRHVTNAIVCSTVLPKCQTRIQVGAIPTAPPFHEIWPGTVSDDHLYQFDPPLRIDPGWGIYTSAASPGNNIATYHWREKAGAPLPPPSDAIATDLANGANMFDGNEGTYAIATAVSFYCGKIWLAPKSVSEMTIKSPAGRSFSGGTPGRIYTWFAEAYDGTSWSQIATGSYTEADYNIQSILSVTFTPTTANGHRMRLVESALANHRVSEMTFA
jgi:hypothetical protein